MKAWERYFQYGCVSLAQQKFGEAARDFRKALSRAENLSDSARAQAKLNQAILLLERHSRGQEPAFSRRAAELASNALALSPAQACVKAQLPQTVEPFPNYVPAPAATPVVTS
jgi:hypothetical protein